MSVSEDVPPAQQGNQLDELKDIVSKTLEKQGVLAKAQAQLRKHVFEALSLTEQQNKEAYQCAPQIDERSVNDQFAMALIRDFLTYHHLDYTLSLMNTESQKKLESTQGITRSEIASRLGLGAQKPDPDGSLLHKLVAKLFDDDVLKPRRSTLTDDVKLKPRASTDSYRSTLDSTSSDRPTILFKQSTAEQADQVKAEPVEPAEASKQFRNPLENLTFSVPTLNELPPLSGKGSAANRRLAPISPDTLQQPRKDKVDVEVLEEQEQTKQAQTAKETPKAKAREDIDRDPLDVLDDLLNSSTNSDDITNAQEEDEEEEEESESDDDDEELKRMAQMNKTMERLRMQSSAFEKLKKESVSPSQSANSSQTGTGTVDEYEDDFGSEELATKDKEESIDIDDIIEEDIDEDIEIDAESQSASQGGDEDIDNMYAAKDEDEDEDDEAADDLLVSKDFKLEDVADIIVDAKTQKVKLQL